MKMVLKTIKYEVIENNLRTATHTQLTVNYSIFGIVFYSRVYTRPIPVFQSVLIQKIEHLEQQIKSNESKDLKTIEQVNQLIDGKISANNQHLKYEIWELGLRLENKLKLGLKDLRLNTSQQKQANEQIEQQFKQNLATASEQIISVASQQNKLYTCANCAKTFDNCRKYAGHKTHCK